MRRIETQLKKKVKRVTPLWVIVIMSVGLLAFLYNEPDFNSDSASEFRQSSNPVIKVGDRNLQDVVAEAPPYSIILFDRAHCIELENTLVIDKPVTLRGLNARLADGISRTQLVLVTSENVTITDFKLHGNVGSVEYAERASLISIQASNFVVERGLVTKASKHGVEVRNRGE